MLVASVADKDCSSQSLHSTLTVPQLIVQTSLDHKPPARILICGKQQIASLLVEQLKPFLLRVGIQHMRRTVSDVVSRVRDIRKKATFDEMPC